MVTYMLDAMRYREGALGAVWATLGSVNLSIWVSGALFMGHRPFILSFMIGICSGISLFITGMEILTPAASTSNWTQVSGKKTCRSLCGMDGLAMQYLVKGLSKQS